MSQALDAERQERREEADALRQRASELQSQLAVQAASAAEQSRDMQRQVAAGSRHAAELQVGITEEPIECRITVAKPFHSM